MAKVAVIGAGSWGTALALQLASNRLDVSLWGHLPAQIEQMRERGENADFLPGFAFPDNLSPEADLAAAVAGAEEVLVVVPSHAFATVVTQLKPLLSSDASLSWATKGLDPGNNALLSDVCQQVLGEHRSLAVISGPTFAREVASGLPTAIVVAASDQAHGERLVDYLHGDTFRPYTSNDLVGVQIGGSAKNVMAIAAGIADGLGYGANSRAALITRGLLEISRLGSALGGQPETFMGLAGLGDLVLTCTDNQSRNRRFGLALASGMTVEQARQSIDQEVEGINTTREVFLKASGMGIEMPITEQTYRVLYEGLSPKAAVHTLLSRQTRPERDAET